MSYVKEITSYIRKEGAPAIKDYLIPWLTDWLNNKLSKISKEGSALDLKTLSFVGDHLISTSRNGLLSYRKTGNKTDFQPLTLGYLEDNCKNIKYFKGVFMKGMLHNKLNKFEIGIWNC